MKKGSLSSSSPLLEPAYQLRQISIFFIHTLESFIASLTTCKISIFQLGYPFKNKFDFTTAGEWDCVAPVERLPTLHYSVDFIFLSLGIMGFIVEI